MPLCTATESGLFTSVPLERKLSTAYLGLESEDQPRNVHMLTVNTGYTLIMPLLMRSHPASLYQTLPISAYSVHGATVPEVPRL